MEPPVRLNNSNGPGQPRKRGGRTGKRSETTEPRKAPAKRSRTRVKAAEPMSEPAAKVSLPPSQEAAVAPAVETGPVVGIADFEEIFTRFQTPLTNFIFRLVGNREQAYDLTQDVFVKAYRALSAGTTIQAAALSSWLYRIASNTATDALRRRRLISWLPLSLFNEDRGVGAGMPGSETPGQQQSYAEEALASAA